MVPQQQDDAHDACHAHPEQGAAEDAEVKGEDGNLYGANREGREELQKEGEHHNARGHVCKANIPGVVPKVAVVNGSMVLAWRKEGRHEMRGRNTGESHCNEYEAENES